LAERWEETGEDWRGSRTRRPCWRQGRCSRQSENRGDQNSLSLAARLAI